MTYYIKQKVFSLANKFTVKDENGNDVYYVEGQIFTLGNKLRITDMTGREVAFIKQRLLAFRPRYEVYVNNFLMATVVKEITFLRPKYRIIGTDWSIEGSVWLHDYRIFSSRGVIASISKKILSWGDSYALNISDDEDQVLALATVITIDCVIASQNN